MSKANQSKKEKFTQPEKKRKTPLIGAMVVLGIAIVVGGIYFGSKSSDNDQYAVANIGEKVNYSSDPLFQAEKEPVQGEEGKVVVATLSEIKDKKFIYTEYQNGEKVVPLTAYTLPSGKVVVAVSLCEPCNSVSFRIVNDKIVCNACGTTWELESLKGVSGACQTYPPERLVYTQNGDKLELEQAVLDNWEPRAL